MSRIVPNLWYTDKAEEAAAFYASILPNSKVDAVTALPADSDFPDLSPDRAFAKYFEGNQVVREAHRIVKATLMPLLGVYVGGQAASDVDDPTDALDQIEALVAQMRAAQPALSKAQAFAKVYQDPANAHLAAAERRQNRPRA